jgi:hypothetical protein
MLNTNKQNQPHFPDPARQPKTKIPQKNKTAAATTTK